MDEGIADYRENLLTIGERAGKEYVIEQTLEKMLTEWDNNLMDLSLYKNTGTIIFW